MAAQKTFGKWQAGGEWGTRKALDKKEAHETVPNSSPTANIIGLTHGVSGAASVASCILVIINCAGGCIEKMIIGGVRVRP